MNTPSGDRELSQVERLQVGIIRAGNGEAVEALTDEQCLGEFGPQVLPLATALSDAVRAEIRAALEPGHATGSEAASWIAPRRGCSSCP